MAKKGAVQRDERAENVDRRQTYVPILGFKAVSMDQNIDLP